jgi:branched-chain amino acid aminotransferase
MIFCIDGNYVPQEKAVVSVLDRGFLFGDSAYETIRAYRGRILFWREHANRLKRSASLLGITLDWDERNPLRILHSLLVRNGCDQARFRIIVTRGTGIIHRLEELRPTWVFTIEPFTPSDDAFYRAGVAAVLVSVVRNATACLNPEIKSSNLLNNVLARREALARGAEEAILLNPKGYVAEGAHSNVFWVTEEGVLETPSQSVGILPGITRQKLIAIAREMGTQVREVESAPDALDRAREIFLSSTSWEALSVSLWNGKPVGAGLQETERGRIARALRDRLRLLYDEQEESE